MEFASFFKASSNSWTPGINAGKGTAGVTLFECLILIGIDVWMEILFGKRFLLPNLDKWKIWIIVLALYFLNYYILVIRGHGLKFERDFSDLEKSKRTRLQMGCRLMELIIAIFCFCSIYAYHRFFHIIPKTGW